MSFNRRSLTILLFCLVLFALLLLLLNEPWQSPVKQQLPTSQSLASSIKSLAPSIKSAPTAMPTTSQTSRTSSKVPLPTESFDTDLALTLLRQIALDEQGYPIINNQLKRQLDNAVNLIGNERSPAELDKLSQLIKQTFEQATAQSVDHILHRYYSYKIAEQNYATTLNATDSVNTLKNEQTLSAMRESYLGHELAEQLFGEEKNYSDYISELTGQLSAPDLSEDTRRNITIELQKKYHQEQKEMEEL